MTVATFARLGALLAGTALAASAAAQSFAPRAGDWESYQGNIQHTGYVPITLNAAASRKIWEWRSPHAADGVLPAINPVTISGGRIAVSDDDYFSPQALYVLNEGDGSVLWSHEFPPTTPGLNPATIINGRIFVATSGHQETLMHSFDAETGALLWATHFDSQWPHFLAPTVDANLVASAGGYYGGIVGFRKATGRVAASNFSLPFVDMFTPAMDDDALYFYTTDRLNVLDRKTFAGTSISDPAPSSTCCYSYIGASMLSLARKRVVTLSGDNFSGRASASTGGYYSRSLVSFDLVGGVLEWRSTDLFITQPAMAKGLIFAGSDTPLRLAALNETDGSLAWAWQPSDGSGGFCRNVIVTDSHVFVSTTNAVHAIDLATRQSVWSIAIPGELALSAKGTLIINEGCRESTGRMVAVKVPRRGG